MSARLSIDVLLGWVPAKIGMTALQYPAALPHQKSTLFSLPNQSLTANKAGEQSLDKAPREAVFTTSLPSWNRRSTIMTSLTSL